jgi:peptidoglycan pentaglycine glycine transferase (the first glycine)
MRTVRPLGQRHREAWDRLVEAGPASGFMQSWDWSVFKEVEGYSVVRLGLFDGETLAGGALAYIFPTPAEAGVLAVPDGPVLDWSSPRAGADFRLRMDALRARPEARKAVVLRVEPRLEELPPALRGLARAPVDLVPDETLVVPLGPEEDMLKAMKPKGRYNARLAERRGVEVSLSSDPADVHELYPVLEQTGRYQDFLVEPKSFFLNLATSLPRPMVRFAFARYKGMLLAAGLAVRHGGTLTYLYGGHLPLFPEVMANYALHWRLMRQGALEGARAYDFYGYVPPGRPGHPYDRFSRFKEKFGGRPIKRIGSRDLVLYDRLADVALGVLQSAAGRTVP